MAEWLQAAPGGDVASAMDQLGPSRKPWLMRTPLPPAPVRPAGADGGNGMAASAVPLALSGFSTPAFAKAKQIMARYPIEPMQAGGTGNASAGPTKFSLGGSLAVQLVRGDMSAAATGTVSFVDHSRVLAFGHPLFQAGELYAPVAAAEVHTVIPSAMSAFVVASPLRELGALVQDRQSTIMADTGLKTGMIPLDIYVDSKQGLRDENGEFHVELLNNRFMTPALAGLSTMNAISYYLPDRDRATVRIDSTVSLRGYEPLEFTDYLYSSDGAGSAIGGARGLRALVPLLMNPFAPVDIQGIQLRVEISYDTNFGRIRELRLPESELPPGERTYVDVVLSRFDGKEVVDRVPFDVPESLAGHIVKLEVTSGDSADLDVAPPRSLDDLVAALRGMLPGTVYAVTLHTANEGVAVDGQLIHDLPASAIDKLHTGGSSQRARVYRPIARSVSPAPRVVDGSGSTVIRVASSER
jgi:hypothetical protein